MMIVTVDAKSIVFWADGDDFEGSLIAWSSFAWLLIFEIDEVIRLIKVRDASVVGVLK